MASHKFTLLLTLQRSTSNTFSTTAGSSGIYVPSKQTMILTDKCAAHA
jgi:hypothetical protein